MSTATLEKPPATLATPPATERPPGVARLGFDSGSFLLRGDAEGEWRLEARTWGAPARATIHRRHLRASWAARQLDPGVPMPARLAPPARAVPTSHRRRRSRKQRRF